MKRKREDNNIRKEVNKNVEFSCIKCTWNKLVVNNNYLKTGLFNLFPNKHSFTLSNIEICTTSLGDIISYLTETSKPPDFMDKKREHWFELFNVENFETHSRNFGYTIYTDGKVPLYV
jgi:hypothetical protein